MPMSPTITVRQLVEQLKTFDQDLEVEVEVEGCDCVGEAGGALLNNGRVLIERTEYVASEED